MKELFHKKILNNHIYVWKMTSSYEDQIKNPLLNSTELISAKELKSENRKKEFLSSRIALKKIFNKELELKHHKSGKPFIKEAKHISISHSSNFLALAFGKENIGVDIEKPQNRMVKLMPKILSEIEFMEFKKEPSIDLACKLWGTKESILKYMGDKKLNYKEDIKVNTTSLDVAKYLKTNFKVEFKKIENMILTYVVRSDKTK
ncbi:MAG: hypothetical protein CND86_02120 [Bacteroidetes bacterium MED-G21]|nr:MAG: hypothetical protein CND86_02120 [Bacteroidetes bacterium MED-G21]